MVIVILLEWMERLLLFREGVELIDSVSIWMFVTGRVCVVTDISAAGSLCLGWTAGWAGLRVKVFVL